MKKYLLSLLLSLIISYVISLLLLIRARNGDITFMEPIYSTLFVFGWGLGTFGYILLISMILGLSFGIYKILNKYSK